MKRSDYKKCQDALRKVRQVIRDGYSSWEELEKDAAAYKAYCLTVDAEMELDKITPPWED